MLHELGFTSFLHRGKLCKNIYAKQVETLTNRHLNNTTRLNFSNWANTSTDRVLSDTGQSSIAAACRFAHTMALAVRQVTQNTKLFLQLLFIGANIGANIQAYAFIQEKHTRNTRTDVSPHNEAPPRCETFSPFSLWMNTKPLLRHCSTLVAFLTYQWKPCND